MLLHTVLSLVFISFPLSASQCLLGHTCGTTCARPCDGIVECSNAEDEATELCATFNCTSIQGNAGNFDADFFQHSSAKFKCAYGGCINEKFVCNGSPDCWDGSDEARDLCSNKKCERREYQCAYGACIRSLWTCNGNLNCVDGSDETEQLCKSKRCRSSQFKCGYGACIPVGERCDGSVDCVDASDESEEECGLGHTTKPPPTPRPPPTPKPPVVSPPQTPSTAPPTKPGIVFTENPVPVDWCHEQSLCSCPQPNQHFCVPCERMSSCSVLGSDAVCSIRPAGGPFSHVKVEVISCGPSPHISVAGFVRNHQTSFCGSAEGVPAESVVWADCWGTAILAQCHPDGTWHTYRGGAKSSPSMTALCQFQEVNSPVCGQRPQFKWPPGRTIHLKAQPQWPWMVGLQKDGSYFCTATIITPFYLLTAGHCITRTRETSDQLLDPRDVKVQIVNGNGGIVTRYISQIHLFPNYTSTPRPSHDVALIRMEKEIIFNYQVYPACINTERFPELKIAATFNRTINEYRWELILQQYDPRCFSPHDRCAATISIDPQQFCAIDIDSAKYLPEGSSGGPYLVNTGSDTREHWVIAGLVSSSYRQTSCVRPFTIFSSVTPYWSWIFKCANEGVCN